ncbi:MAG: sugar transferase, partial [Candidatus Kapabacteria bacterium]|nr:sugar transferase [Candidatus Kapabacteria bacterium]
YRRRLKVRPGVTGWWQVKARSNPESLEEIQQRLRYDFFYIENMSFKLDLEIMVRTVFVMLRGHGQA